MNDHFITLSLLTWRCFITINISAIVIIFNTTLKLLGKKFQSGIALTVFIEIVDKELLNTKPVKM